MCAVLPVSPEDGTKGDPCMQKLWTGNGHTVTRSVSTPSQGGSLLPHNSPWSVYSYTQAGIRSRPWQANNEASDAA